MALKRNLDISLRISIKFDALMGQIRDGQIATAFEKPLQTLDTDGHVEPMNESNFTEHRIEHRYLPTEVQLPQSPQAHRAELHNLLSSNLSSRMESIYV